MDDQAGAIGVAEFAADQEIGCSPPVGADRDVGQVAGVRAERIDMAVLLAGRVPVRTRARKAR